MQEAPAPAPEEIEEGSPYVVSNGFFLGMKPGGSIAEFKDGLRADVLQTGEGDFDVFYIDGAEGNEVEELNTVDGKASANAQNLARSLVETFVLHQGRQRASPCLVSRVRSLRVSDVKLLQGFSAGFEALNRMYH